MKRERNECSFCLASEGDDGCAYEDRANAVKICWGNISTIFADCEVVKSRFCRKMLVFCWDGIEAFIEVDVGGFVGGFALCPNWHRGEDFVTDMMDMILCVVIRVHIT